MASCLHKPGWGIVYPLVVHDRHPQLDEYDKLLGLDDLVVGEEKEPIDKKKAEANAKTLRRVKSEDEKRSAETDPNIGIRQVAKELKENARKGKR